MRLLQRLSWTALVSCGCYGSNPPLPNGGYNLERVSYEAPAKPDALVTDFATLKVKELAEKPHPLVFPIDKLRVAHPLVFQGSIVPINPKIEKSLVTVEFFSMMPDSRRLITQTCQTLTEKASDGTLRFKMATGGPKTKGPQFVELTFIDSVDGKDLQVVIATGEVTIE